MATLHLLDWGVIAVYLAAMLGMSAWLSRGQKDIRDYYLGGNRAGPLPIALSTMATQCSTNSLLGAPAFVAFTGGLVWLQYELAVPLAMAVLLLFIMPVFRGLNLVSVYAYLEHRFGVEARTTMSVLFQFLRAFSTGVTVFGISLVLAYVMQIPFFWAVMLVGVFTVAYDVMGGIRAVIYSDVIQLIVLVSSIVVGIGIAVVLVGGWSEVWAAAGAEVGQTLDWTGHGLGDGKTFAFWPMLVGGFFLYVSYYGCDQTQIQRELSSRSVEHSRISLFLGGLLRFPLVLLYCILGVCLAAYIQLHPGFMDKLVRPVMTENGMETVQDVNILVPAFALEYFPVGLAGLLIAGLLAAAMSSLDSTINALSALTMEDLVARFRKRPLTERQSFWMAKVLTLFWGGVCIAFAFVVGDIASTVIESVNKIGSLINGPLLAVFILGLMTRRANQRGVLTGLVLGFAGNLLLWRYVPSVSWLWWNVIGFAVTLAVGYGFSRVSPGGAKEPGSEVLADLSDPEFRAQFKTWIPKAGMLVLYFGFMLWLLSVIPGIVGFG